VEELGDGSGEYREGEGVHNDLLLVLIKNEESLGSGLAEGVEAGAEVKLNASIDEGEDFTPEGGVRPDQLGVDELVLADVG
jgi:hypothetical protein